MESQSFLVTGGCGLQGSSVVETLRERYPAARVAVMARNPTINTLAGVDYHKGDITSPTDLDACLAAAKPTVVFHCAAAVVGTRAHVAESVVRGINVGGTKLLLDKCKTLGSVKAFIFTSSVSVIQRAGVDIDGADETWPMVNSKEDPSVLIYPATKADAERLVTAADDGDGGMRTCSIRPSAIYGERDNDVTPAMMRLAAALRQVQLGNNDKFFATTYVGNSTHAHLLAAEKLLSPDPAVRDLVGGETFTICNEALYTFWDFARTIWFQAGVGPPRDSPEYKPENLRIVSAQVAAWFAWAVEWWAWAWGTPPKISQIMVGLVTRTRRFDLSKAKRVLGYREQFDWEEGCQRAAKWYKENQNRDSKTK